MAAAHPFGAFVRCGIKRIGCVRRIKVKQYFESDVTCYTVKAKFLPLYLV